MSVPTLVRQRILRSVLELDGPLEIALGDLVGLPWDADEELVILEPGHVIELLKRFQRGELYSVDVERWANAVEGRDDIGFNVESRAVLEQAIFALANPDLQGLLTTDAAERWVERLLAVREQSATPE